MRVVLPIAAALLASPALAAPATYTVDPTHTEVTLLMNFEPAGVAEKAGDATGLVDRRIEGDLKRFKGFIESRGTESGGWRGTV